jgi:hypothetical protein
MRGHQTEAAHYREIADKVRGLALEARSAEIVEDRSPPPFATFPQEFTISSGADGERLWAAGGRNDADLESHRWATRPNTHSGWHCRATEPHRVAKPRRAFAKTHQISASDARPSSALQRHEVNAAARPPRRNEDFGLVRRRLQPRIVVQGRRTNQRNRGFLTVLGPMLA